MSTRTNTRKAIPKGIRFDVLKRDSFKCQYCGATAPEVLLHIDHIEPVSKGGTNDITNLITSCQPCNSGKRDKKLDENTSLAKSRNQMEELQERREQIEMMMEWKNSLRDLKDNLVDRLIEYWNDVSPGLSINQYGRNGIQKLLREFSVDEICQAIDIAVEQYFRYDDDGNVTQDSGNNALNKLSGICFLRQDDAINPERKELRYIRGILNKRLNKHGYTQNEALDLLVSAHSSGVPLETIRSLAIDAVEWRRFTYDLDDEIDKVLPGQE